MRRSLSSPRLAGSLAILATVIFAQAASAWVETRVTTSAAPSTNPDVTFDAFDGLHVLWEETGEIRHLQHDGLGWMPMIVVGEGSGFDRYTCWT